MGFKQAKNCMHVPYGLVNLKGGKISSREGELIYAEELVEQVIEDAKSTVKEKHKGLKKDEIEERARKIGLAALKFSFLTQDNNKEILFDKEKSLSFEGETGPYVQYAHARICSILEKVGKNIKKDADFSLLKTENEEKLVRLLAVFPETVEDAAKHYKPSIITRYLLDLRQVFNEFYQSNQILKEKADIRDARLLLIRSVKEVLKSGLELLGIESPEKM